MKIKTIRQLKAIRKKDGDKKLCKDLGVSLRSIQHWAKNLYGSKLIEVVLDYKYREMKMDKSLEKYVEKPRS